MPERGEAGDGVKEPDWVRIVLAGEGRQAEVRAGQPVGVHAAGDRFRPMFHPAARSDRSPVVAHRR